MLLKDNAEDLAPVITHIVNASYAKGIVPTVWKASNVISIPKTQASSAMKDWRPVSLTSCLEKIQEKCIVRKIMPTVLSQSRNQQHAYLHKTSTTTALVKAVHSWMVAADSKQPIIVRVLLADMSKAFDQVDHSRLMITLANLELCPRLLTWLHSHLTGRVQRVVANGIHSSWIEVTSGVPQGGVISPYLFLLYMLTRETLFMDTLDIGYADDIGLSWAIPLNKVISDKTMALEAEQLDKWAKENSMQLKSEFGDKSVELRICFAKYLSQPAPLVLGGEEVPVVTTTKYLGFHLDSDLSGDSHIDRMVRKASKRLHFLTVLVRHGLPQQDLLTIYTTLVRTCLEYGSVLLVGCNNKNQAVQLERVQKRALKIISRGGAMPELPTLCSWSARWATVNIHSTNCCLKPEWRSPRGTCAVGITFQSTNIIPKDLDNRYCQQQSGCVIRT